MKENSNTLKGIAIPGFLNIIFNLPNFMRKITDRRDAKPKMNKLQAIAISNLWC
jgi:hypothetical protein